jgi:segregation and condensation protein B
MDKEILTQIIEAILFSSQYALTPKQIAKSLGIKKTGEIREAIKELNIFYQTHNRSFFIQKVADGFQLRSDPKFKKWIKRGQIVKTIQLSPSVLETLSIVAYNQPVTRSEIEEIRTVDSTYSLRSLLDKSLIKIAGKKEIPGRPLLYKTTNYFLELFGFEALNDLPRPEDFDIMSPQDNETVI